MKSTYKNGCPDPCSLEAFLQDQMDSSLLKEKIRLHISQCSHCQTSIHELSQFFHIIEDEFKRPIPNQLFKLFSEIERENVSISGILLHPLKPLNGHISLDFKSRVIDPENFMQPGQPPNSMDHDDILLRVIQSKSSAETVIYAFAHNEKLFRNIRLSLKTNDKKFVSDSLGKIEVNADDLNQLKNAVITVTVKK
ncbi:MAG TPA: hypothetical protein ENN22_00065 [bacterium]|nr:hypothetical protein [bacterium]